MIMKNKVNVALQILPRSTTKETYSIVDEAIEIIKKSGIKYQVCPFETVLEGYYDEIMSLIKKIHQECYKSGTETMMTYIKIQTSADTDVTIDDKMHKYK
jgi:uncharacterized protein (TIGR00106 family)